MGFRKLREQTDAPIDASEAAMRYTQRLHRAIRSIPIEYRGLALRTVLDMHKLSLAAGTTGPNVERRGRPTKEATAAQKLLEQEELARAEAERVLGGARHA
jgi:hypothetical protein